MHISHVQMHLRKAANCACISNAKSLRNTFHIYITFLYNGLIKRFLEHFDADTVFFISKITIYFVFISIIVTNIGNFILFEIPAIRFIIRACISCAFGWSHLRKAANRIGQIGNKGKIDFFLHCVDDAFFADEHCRDGRRISRAILVVLRLFILRSTFLCSCIVSFTRIVFVDILMWIYSEEYRAWPLATNHLMKNLH